MKYKLSIRNLSIVLWKFKIFHQKLTHTICLIQNKRTTRNWYKIKITKSIQMAIIRPMKVTKINNPISNHTIQSALIVNSLEMINQVTLTLLSHWILNNKLIKANNLNLLNKWNLRNRLKLKRPSKNPTRHPLS